MTDGSPQALRTQQPTPSIRVRRATASNSSTLLSLIDALAAYEELEGPTYEAKARLIEDGFGETPRYEAYLVEAEGRTVGYAITFETYSTFLARPTLYLEDLFILPEARRLGAGKAVFRQLAQVANERGCGRIEWTVLDWNDLAIGFYRRLGGQHMSEWHHYRLDDEAISRIAREDHDP